MACRLLAVEWCRHSGGIDHLGRAGYLFDHLFMLFMLYIYLLQISYCLQWCRHSGQIDHLGCAGAGWSTEQELTCASLCPTPPLTAQLYRTMQTKADCRREVGLLHCCTVHCSGCSVVQHQCSAMHWLQWRAESNWRKKTPRALVRPSNDWAPWRKKWQS